MNTIIGLLASLALVLSTLAFFVASFFIKRRLDDMDIPETMARSIVICTFL